MAGEAEVKKLGPCCEAYTWSSGIMKAIKIQQTSIFIFLWLQSAKIFFYKKQYFLKQEFNRLTQRMSETYKHIRQ